jgi:hypothetical protein
MNLWVSQIVENLGAAQLAASQEGLFSMQLLSYYK